MSITFAAAVLSILPLFVQQAPPPQAGHATSWPIPGVVPAGSGVQSPRLIKEVKPNYTGDAMRARVQGVVQLECVVEVDGSVGPVRVVQSLDTVYGLDNEAIRAVKRWRFAPGTKDGTPVRVAVTVELSFRLRERGDAPSPASGWPTSFAEGSEVPGAPPAGWSEEVVETPALRIRVAYPPGWSLRRDPGAGRLAVLEADDARGHRAISIERPTPAAGDLVRPLPEPALKAFLDSVGQTQAWQGADVTMVSSGQVPRPGGMWLWLETSAPTVELRNAPAAVVEHMRTAHDGMRIWSFNTTAGGQLVQVFCSVLHAANTTEADKQEEIRRAGLEFGAMLQRMAVEAR
jgi:TonB family protein